jgi:hypothetical protein
LANAQEDKEFVKGAESLEEFFPVKSREKKAKMMFQVILMESLRG